MKYANYTSAIGFCRNFSRSRRAQIAEIDGRMPATRAAKTWGFKSAACLKKWVRSTEWHHVGRFAAATDYYDVESWIRDESLWLSDIVGLSADLTKRGREMVLRPLVTRIVRESLDSTFKPSWSHKLDSQRRLAEYKARS